ncbi:LytTR family DNA-binding domain-containing protein [Fluviicola sp.]|uniref:LytR/AlgR family response regulator transcription factor n=1 Tax=Fluviicola sp. TaxID=1917219 RepID=UPI0026157070|nr:LytTR family DNA-binding domain-containing protein [Fluviicola sp.]
MTRQYSLIAIDDEAPSIRLIERFCSGIPHLQFLEGFNSPQKALDFISKNQVDVLFLDIEMPGMSGLEFAKKCPDHLKIIFSTAFEQFAIEGFNLSAVDYILKPYSVERFNQAIEKAIRIIELESLKKIEEEIVVKVNYSNRKIKLDSILYIESLDDNITINLVNQDSITFRNTLKAFTQELPESRFMRIHRSYVIALNKINSYQKNKVVIGEKEFPVSIQYKEAFLNALNNQ